MGLAELVNNSKIILKTLKTQKEILNHLELSEKELKKNSEDSILKGFGYLCQAQNIYFYEGMQNQKINERLKKLSSEYMNHFNS